MEGGGEEAEIIQDEIIEPPFPWATNRRAIVHSIRELQSLGIAVVEGEMVCINCLARYTVSYDIMAKYSEVEEFMRRYHPMHERAPLEWMHPVLVMCRWCNQGGRIVPDNHRDINWLFMFLGQTLGFCTVEQLKYFCQHNNRRRTGAKDLLLYDTYASIRKQLDPTAKPFG